LFTGAALVPNRRAAWRASVAPHWLRCLLVPCECSGSRVTPTAVTSDAVDQAWLATKVSGPRQRDREISPHLVASPLNRPGYGRSRVRPRACPRPQRFREKPGDVRLARLVGRPSPSSISSLGLQGVASNVPSAHGQTLAVAFAGRQHDGSKSRAAIDESKRELAGAGLCARFDRAGLARRIRRALGRQPPCIRKPPPLVDDRGAPTAGGVATFGCLRRRCHATRPTPRSAPIGSRSIRFRDVPLTISRSHIRGASASNSPLPFAFDRGDGGRPAACASLRR